MQSVFQPGQYIVVDEIMSGWRGLEYKHSASGCPHLTKIIRKPVPVGTECKASACGVSGVLLGIEFLEGKLAMNSKSYQEAYGAGTATIVLIKI